MNYDNKIANTFNKNNQINYTASKKVSEMNVDELLALRAQNAALMLCDRAQYEVPQNGKFIPLSLEFEIPGTLNKGKYCVEHDEINPKDLRRFSIGAYRKGSDEIHKEYLGKIGGMTKKELLEFLENEDNFELFRKTLKSVSDDVDNNYI